MYTRNDRFSGNDRYSGLQGPDRFFRYIRRYLYLMICSSPVAYLIIKSVVCWVPIIRDDKTNYYQ